MTLNQQGWADIDDILAKAPGQITRDEILQIVATSDKQRFALSPDQTRIRANQGHSVKVDLGLAPILPKTVLFHGTATRNLNAILNEGLTKQSRHHVHLSSHVTTARAVGARYGEPVVLEVDAPAMHRAGYQFYRSGNGVWLTDHVPARFISIHDRSTV